MGASGIQVGVALTQDEQAERRVLDAARDAFAEAQRRAPGLILCRAGCDSCCRKRPFSITQADAARLRAGMRQLESASAIAIRERAAEYAARIERDFPGEWNTGALTDNTEWRDWFYGRHEGLACPALSPETGACLIHEHRPVCCRLYGPLIQIGEEVSGPCPLNYEGLTADEIQRRAVRIDMPELASPGEGEPETMIVFALLANGEEVPRTRPRPGNLL